MRNVSRAFAALAAASVINQLIGLAILGLITRRVGLGGLGAWYVAQSVAAYFGMCSSLGMQQVGAREIARGTDPAKTGFEVNFAQAALAVPLYCILALLSVTGLIGGQTGEVIPVAGLAFIFGAATCDWALQALHRGRIVALLQLIGQVLYAVLAILIYRGREHSVLPYALLNMLGLSVVALGTLVIFVGLTGRPPLHFSVRTAVTRARSSIHFASSALIVQVYWALGPVLIGAIGTLHEAGVYGVALRFPQGFMLLSRIWIQTVFPLSARLAKLDPAKLVRQTQAITVLGLLLLFPAVATSVAIAKPLMEATFGSAAAPAAGPFVLLTGVGVVFFFSLNLSNVLLAIDEERRYLKLALVAGVLAVGVNVGLIPLIGPYAPGVSLLVSECLIAVVSAYIIDARLGSIIPGGAVARSAGVGIGCGAFAGGAAYLFSGPVAGGCIASAVYSGATLVLAGPGSVRLALRRPQ